MNKIEERLRLLTIPQLEILKALANSKDGVLESKEIISSTSTAVTNFGAYIAALKKFKSDDGQSIVIPAGKTSEGIRWQLNEKVISKDSLNEILNGMNLPEPE